MADGSRDVTIKIRLQAEGQADIRKGIEEAVSKPAKIAQGEMGKVRSSTVEAAGGSPRSARRRMRSIRR